MKDFSSEAGFQINGNETLKLASDLTNKFISRFILNDSSKGTWRMLCGKPGCGKTMLARTVFRSVFKFSSDAKDARKTTFIPTISFIRWPEVGSDLTNDQEFGAVLRDRIQAADLVILDDIGADTDAYRAGRHINRLQVLLDRCEKKWLFITSNLSQEQFLDHYGERIASRLARCVTLWVDAPDHRINTKNQ